MDTFKEGIDTFTALSLFLQALRLKGLELCNPATHFAVPDSKMLTTYVLDDARIAALNAKGIRIVKDSQAPNMMYFVDQHPQDRADHDPDCSPSNSWSFRLENGSFNLQISLYVKLYVDMRQRGIVLRPQVAGTGGSAVDSGSQFRMFRALTDHDPNALPVAKEIAASDGTFVISWTDLGLGGLRSSSDLFREFMKGNETILQIEKLKIFNPAPFEVGNDELYISEPAQPRLFKAWRKQLVDFRNKLVQ